MYRKNTAGQFICVQLILTATGAVGTGLTPAARRCIDGTFAAGGGTFTEDGTTGSYKYALAQADTNGNDISIIVTATGCIPVCVNFVTTAADPTDTVRFGLTALPNAAADAAGGLPISDAGGLDLDARLDAAVSSRMATYTQPTGFLAATFPAGTIANTTNITAGTITTVSGNVTGSVGSVAAGGIVSASFGAGAINAAVLATDTITAAKVAPDTFGASELAASAVDKIADQIWDELLSGHVVVGSSGAALAAAGSAGDPWTTALPGAYGAGSAGFIIGTNVDAPISSRATPTNITAGTITTVTNLTNAPTVGDLTAAMKASVNAEALDVLTIDTYAEPGQGTPAATTSLAAKLNYLYKAWRNRVTQTSTTYSLFADDATTVDQKATVSDDGTTFVRGELASGP